jgi:WD40 repeat protein
MGRYAYGWTWVGTCLMRQSLLPSSICTCNTNLQPADGSSFNLHLSCSFSGNSTVMTQTCLGTYNYTRVSTYETPVRADRMQSVSFAIDSEDRKANRASVPVTLGFTAANPIPSGGTLTLNYPSGFFATSVIPFIEPGASSLGEFMAWCGETTTSSLIITTHGAAISAQAFTVTIQGFTMGSATAGADVSLQSSSDINASAPVASGQIFGQVLNVTFDISLYDRIAGKPSVPLTLGFVPASPIPPGGTITVTYPHLFFNLSSRPVQAIGKDGIANLTLAFSAVTSTFFVITTSGATISASSLSLLINGMTMGAASAGGQSVTVRTSMDKLASAAVSSGYIIASISAPASSSSGYIPASNYAPLSWLPRNHSYHGAGKDTMVASVRFTSSSHVSSSDLTCSTSWNREYCNSFNIRQSVFVNTDVYVDIEMANSGLSKMSIHYFRIPIHLSSFSSFQGYLIATKSFQIAWSPANDKLVTYLETTSTAGSDLNVARVWNIAKIVFCTIPMPQSFFHPSMWSPDGSMIVSDKVVYDSNTGYPKLSLSGSTLTSLAWSRDGSKLLSGHSDGFVHIHHIMTQKLEMTFAGHNSAIYSIAWSPYETRFATGSADSTVRVWSIQRNASLFICSGHNASISKIWWQDNVTVTAVASDDSQLTWLLPPE